MIYDPLFLTEPQSFYIPMIADPKVSGTLYAGLAHVWRTNDDGGPRAYLDKHCNEFFGDFAAPCGDWEPLGGPVGSGTPGDLVAGPSSDKGTGLGRGRCPRSQRHWDAMGRYPAGQSMDVEECRCRSGESDLLARRHTIAAAPVRQRHRR